MTNKQTRGMAVRQDIATWYTPEEKLPPEDEIVVITFNGPRHIHALGCGAYCEDEGWWLIYGMNETDSDKMTVEAWCDLEPYMMGGGTDEHPDKERIYEQLIEEHCGDCPLGRL